MNWQSVTLLVVPALILVASSTMLFCGLHGRRINSHRYCRFCKFDLFGQDAVGDCPECGADLRLRGAVRVGRRRRRDGLVMLGILLVPLSAGAVVLGWETYRGVDFSGYLPVSLLIRNATGSDSPQRDAALRELAVRVAYGKLSASQIADLADRALACQADQSEPWSPLWGAFIEKAQAANVLPAARWDAYTTGAVQLHLRLRPRVGPGDPLPWLLVASPPRVGSAHPFYSQVVNCALDGDSLNGGGMTYHFGLDLTDLHEQPLGNPWTGDLNTPFIHNLGPAPRSPGPQTATFTGTLEIYDASPPTGKLLLTKPLTLTADWTLVGPGESVRVNTDEKFRPAIETALKARVVLRDATFLEVKISAARPPIDLACALSIRWGGQTRVAPYSILLPAGIDSSEVIGRWEADAAREVGSPHDFEEVLRNLPPDADVILAPDARRAAETLNVNEIWGGRIEMSHLAILHEKK